MMLCHHSTLVNSHIFVDVAEAYAYLYAANQVPASVLEHFVAVNQEQVV